jgi:hypothetical protein
MKNNPDETRWLWQTCAIVVAFTMIGNAAFVWYLSKPRELWAKYSTAEKSSYDLALAEPSIEIHAP